MNYKKFLKKNKFSLRQQRAVKVLLQDMISQIDRECERKDDNGKRGLALLFDWLLKCWRLTGVGNKRNLFILYNLGFFACGIAAVQGFLYRGFDSFSLAAFCAAVLFATLVFRLIKRYGSVVPDEQEVGTVPLEIAGFNRKSLIQGGNEGGGRCAADFGSNNPVGQVQALPVIASAERKIVLDFASTSLSAGSSRSKLRCPLRRKPARLPSAHTHPVPISNNEGQQFLSEGASGRGAVSCPAKRTPPGRGQFHCLRAQPEFEIEVRRASAGRFTDGQMSQKLLSQAACPGKITTQ